MDTYDNQDAFEPPLVPGGVSVRINNRDWPENGDTYTRIIDREFCRNKQEAPKRADGNLDHNSV